MSRICLNMLHSMVLYLTRIVKKTIFAELKIIERVPTYSVSEFFLFL